MVETTKHAMWEFQQYYQKYIENYSKNLFRKLSPKLIPNIFLLGILKEDSQNPSISLEPKIEGISIEKLKEIDKLAKKLYDEDPQKDKTHTQSYINENYHEDLRIKHLCEAAHRLIDEHFKPLKKISFVANPVRINKYDVFVILQFDEDIYNDFYRLKRTELEASNQRKSKIYGSLIDSVIDIFLFKAIQLLYKPNQDRRNYSLHTDINEIIRIAGASFIGTAISAASNSRATYDLFNICNYISSLKYEGGTSKGKLLIAANNHPNVDLKINLKKTVPLSPSRILRKLLEITSDKLYLYTDGNEILGFAEINGSYDHKNENLFEVSFTGEQRWNLKHADKILMEVNYTNPDLPKNKLDKNKFEVALRKVFDMSDDNIKMYQEVINSAVDQKHGTIIIISKEAKNEAIRLKNQSIMIKPHKPDHETIRLITTIDGAALFDDLGICHSIGTILDGHASNNGSASRGARYNSAIRYIDEHKNDAIAIIISEDGMVNLYPDLMSQINKSEIIDKLEILKKELNAEKPNYDQYQPILFWFDEHRFYLREDICKELNMLKKKLEEKLIIDSSRSYVELLDFKPNPEIDDSYFI